MKIYYKLILSILLITHTISNAAEIKPSMSDFEKGFKELNPKIIENLYLKDGVVISKGTKIEGNTSIAKRFKEKGIKKVNVKFIPKEIINGDDLIYERGIFKDFDKKTDKEIGHGDYFILWKKDGDGYKIKLHTWSEN